jgi:hypothetical protein
MRDADRTVLRIAKKFKRTYDISPRPSAPGPAGLDPCQFIPVMKLNQAVGRALPIRRRHGLPA